MKFSRQKADYIIGLSRMVTDGSLALEELRLLDNADVVSRLCSIRGIGHWSAQWVLLAGLGRSEAFPTGDLALRRAISRYYFHGEKVNDDRLKSLSERWGKYRGYAALYIFAALRQKLQA